MSANIWTTRHAIGGRNNEPSLREDGTLRPDVYHVDERGCWIWHASLRGASPTGTLGSKQGFPICVRRFLYEKHIGPAPVKVYAGCGNPRCVNPEHISTKPLSYAGTARRKHIREVYAQHPGATLEELAWLTGTAPSTVSQALPEDAPRGCGRVYRRYAGRECPPRPAGVSDRNWEVFQRTLKGENMTALSKEFGLSRQRAAQIADAVDQRVRRIRR
jgi:hypothetical protein